jgi:hypothetical protein
MFFCKTQSSSMIILALLYSLNLNKESQCISIRLCLLDKLSSQMVCTNPIMGKEKMEEENDQYPQDIIVFVRSIGGREVLRTHTHSHTHTHKQLKKCVVPAPSRSVVYTDNNPLQCTTFP